MIWLILSAGDASLLLLQLLRVAVNIDSAQLGCGMSGMSVAALLILIVEMG